MELQSHPLLSHIPLPYAWWKTFIFSCSFIFSLFEPLIFQWRSLPQAHFRSADTQSPSNPMTVSSLVHTMRILEEWWSFFLHASLISKMMRLLELQKFLYDRIQLRTLCNVLYFNVFFRFQACVVLVFRFFFLRMNTVLIKMKIIWSAIVQEKMCLSLPILLHQLSWLTLKSCVPTIRLSYDRFDSGIFCPIFYLCVLGIRHTPWASGLSITVAVSNVVHTTSTEPFLSRWES